MTVYCEYCGGIIDTTIHKYCPNCGAKFIDNKKIEKEKINLQALEEIKNKERMLHYDKNKTRREEILIRRKTDEIREKREKLKYNFVKFCVIATFVVLAGLCIASYKGWL